VANDCCGIVANSGFFYEQPLLLIQRLGVYFEITDTLLQKRHYPCSFCSTSSLMPSLMSVNSVAKQAKNLSN
jgi:hypothetical protein